MLIDRQVFLYAITRDYGFAPNPFHGVCTLATCKPQLRKSAQIGDWVIGFTGANLSRDIRIICCMEVSDKLTFQEYWDHPQFLCKRPVRNGSKASLVGDNIYHRVSGKWVQEDSHHSNADGTLNEHNLKTDTSADFVLISQRFVYFGRSAIPVPQKIRQATGLRRVRNYHKWPYSIAKPLIEHVMQYHDVHLLKDVPFDFDSASARYSGIGQRIINE